MNFGFSEEQELLRAEVRRFLDQNCPLEEVRKLAATEEGFSRLMALQEEIQANSGNESDLEGYGLASERPVT